ncbi:MAG: hypothetical protein RLZZ592_2105 [Pseudomonadota bacterium]|nr:hypothetical protein [Pseudomonadota bacterium]
MRADNSRAMKVFDLQCVGGHGFEGWFGSEDDYQSQCGRGLLTCPLCGSAQVMRLPSAPRLNLSGSGRDEPVRLRAPLGSPVSHPAPAPTPERQQAEAVFLQAVRHVLAHTEDVGARFAEEARRIHHGESEARGIRGQTTPEERQELREEGIEVFSLPVPEGLEGPLQ